MNGKKVIVTLVLVVLLIYMYNLSHPLSSVEVKAPVAMKNVLLDSFTKDWANIREAIDPDHKMQNFLVTDYRLLYSPNGTVTELELFFQPPVQNDQQTTYHVHWEENFTNYVISISHGKPLQTPLQGQITMDNFVKMLTPQTIEAMTPHGAKVDGVSMTFAQTYQRLSEANFKQMPNSYFEIRDGKVVGPVKQGEGYLMTVFPLHRVSDGGMRGIVPRYYFLGGFGDYTLADPSP